MSSSRAEEALRLFAALQNKLETETRQNEVSTASVHSSTVKPLLRVSQSSSLSYSSTGLYNNCGAKAATAATPTRRRTSTTTITAAATTVAAAASSSLSSSSFVIPAASITAGSASIEELKRKLEVADGIMKRLHGKNQQLVQRLSAMERERSTVNMAASSAEVVHLREKLRLREEEIDQLKKQLKSVDETVKRDSSCSSIPLPHLVRRVQQLEDQYKELLDIKIDAVLKESSVEKINTEVKKLFSHMKNKMMTDACQHEAEVRRLNESLVEVERRLAAVRKNSKTYV